MGKRIDPVRNGAMHRNRFRGTGVQMTKWNYSSLSMIRRKLICWRIGHLPSRLAIPNKKGRVPCLRCTGSAKALVSSDTRAREGML